MEQQYFQKEENLLTELVNWNNVEKLCAGVYGDDVLKDRSFQRMKMQEYQRLFAKYQFREKPSVDELALHKMLRYQVRKIEQHLYPNPWRRLLQRGIDRIAARIGRKRHNDYMPSDFTIGNTPIAQAFNAVKGNADTLSRQQDEQQRPEGFRVQNLGQRDNNVANEHKLGIH